MIARPTRHTIIRRTQGRDYTLPDPQFAAASLSYRADEIAIERELLFDVLYGNPSSRSPTD